MQFGSWKHENNGEYEVNMTPLIDVSLVLVVMLLLATPLAFESSIGVRNAEKTASRAPKVEQNERVELVVVSDDSVMVNRRIVARGQLKVVLEPMIAASVNRSVLIGCDQGVSHGAFVNVLDQAKLSGAIEIGVFER